MAHKKTPFIQGQALLEFALIITVLLMMMFLIIESARILWAWNTVQNAAREGARYAITGQFDDPCNSADLPKFADICDGTDSQTLRVASIINVAHQGLSGLPLNEASGIFEDDNYYQIEVWGVNDQGVIQPDFGGMPNTPVVVRAFYRVPIITPLLQPIVPSVTVFGQVTMNNESFGQLGNANQGQGVPPELPPIPTAGVTPSPTFTPTNTPSPTLGPPPTDTPTPTY
ncbi:MAG: pilus assembly protein, partial [Anaerolineae bacterium]